MSNATVSERPHHPMLCDISRMPLIPLNTIKNPQTHKVCLFHVFFQLLPKGTLVLMPFLSVPPVVSRAPTGQTNCSNCLCQWDPLISTPAEWLGREQGHRQSQSSCLLCCLEFTHTTPLNEGNAEPSTMVPENARTPLSHAGRLICSVHIPSSTRS